MIADRVSVIHTREAGLAFLRTIDAIKPDALGEVVVQDFDSVAVENTHNFAGEFSSKQLC
jgi:hypothetical protein